MIRASIDGYGYTFYKNKNSHNIVGRFEIINYPDRMEIWNLIIFPQYQNKGFGTQMVEELVDKFFNNEKELSLYVRMWNKHAIHIYQKAGFEIVEGSPYKDAHKMIYAERK